MGKVGDVDFQYILNGVGLKVFDDIFVACLCDSRKDSANSCVRIIIKLQQLPG